MNVECDVQSESDSLTMNAGTALGKAQAIQRDSAAKRSAVRSTQLWVVATVTCSVIVLTTFAGFAHLRFGSVRSGLAYLAGERLIVDHRTKSFGELATGDERTVVFAVRNLTGRAVQIVGAKVDCTCIKVDGLPRTVAHGAESRIGVLVRKGKKTGNVAEAIVLYTDRPDVPRLALRLVGEFHE